MKLRILEFAQDRKQIQNRLYERTPKIVEHLLCLVLDPDSLCRDHWKKEIYSFLNDIDLLKGTNKVPKASFIYDATYGVKQDRVRSEKYMKKFVLDVCTKENIKTNKQLNQIMTELDNVCASYFTWLSKMLNENEYVTLEEVSNKIDELIKKE